MLINYIAHLDPFYHTGGGEQATRRFLEVGRERGHTIHITSQDPYRVDYCDGAQLNLFWDVFNCPHVHSPFSLSKVRQWAASRPYVFGANAYEDFCVLGTVPCNGATDGVLCGVSSEHPTFGVGGVGRRHPVACAAKARASLWHQADLTVFMSKNHQILTEKVVGRLTNCLVVAPPVSGLELFYDRHLPRSIDLLSYGGHLEHKGFFNIRERFPDREVHFLGGGGEDLPRKYNYGKVIPSVPYSEMPELLARTKTFVHLPRWVEPYGLTTLQAYLSGCELVLNEWADVIQGRTEEQVRSDAARSASCIDFWEGVEKIPVSRPIEITVNQAPLISVVVPCFNYGDHLLEAANSVAAQSYPHKEMIIVDDESTDNSVAVAQSIVANAAFSTRLIQKKNGGPADARNTGISVARGEWIALLDADDVYAPNYLERIASAHNGPLGPELIGIQLREFGCSSAPWHPNPCTLDRLRVENTFPYASAFTKSLWQQVGGFYVGNGFGTEDWTFWISCLKLSPSIVQLQEELLRYRAHSEGLYSVSQRCRTHSFGMVYTMHPELFDTEQILGVHEGMTLANPEVETRLNKVILRFPKLAMPYFWRSLLRRGAGDVQGEWEDLVCAAENSAFSNWQILVRLVEASARVLPESRASLPTPEALLLRARLELCEPNQDLRRSALLYLSGCSLNLAWRPHAQSTPTELPPTTCMLIAQNLTQRVI